MAEKGSGPKCARPGCERIPKAGTECFAHRGRKPKPPRKGCDFPGCENLQYRSSGLCYLHSIQRGKGEELRPVGLRGTDPKDDPPCLAPGCLRVPVIDGLCRVDWERSQDLPGAIPPEVPTGLTPCPVWGCERLKRARHVVCNVHRTRAKRFSLPPHVYRDMVNSGCEICGSLERMAIDHDHDCCPKAATSCGKCIRGALCGNCNNMLGHGKTPETLRRGADYLERFKTS